MESTLDYQLQLKILKEINDMKTPYFIIHKDKLNENISEFQNALDLLWPNSQMSYSVKTNSLPWLLQYLNKQGIFAEVVSDEEYLLAKRCGFIDENIIFNGPIKSEKLFANSLDCGAIVNIDSKRELDYLLSLKNTYCDNIGVRINPDPSIFDSNDIEYGIEGFRFGFSDETGELEKAIKIVNSKSNSIGIHLHCNSVTRSKDVYVQLAKYASNIIQKYDLNISYIDIGGGFFGGVPGKTSPLEYIKSIKSIFEKKIDINKTKLYIEPGSAIIGSTTDLVTSVIDTKNTIKSTIVTTDGSRIHIDPLWKKKNYLYSIESESKDLSNKQIICGYTCMDHDRIMNIMNMPKLEIGDKIIYHRVGAYTMTFGGMFIKYHPDVYLNDSGSLKLIRKSIQFNDYYDIHSV